MWNNAEVVALVDQDGVVRAISRNEEEAPIRHVLGRHVLSAISDERRAAAESALADVRAGAEVQLLTSAVGDDGEVFWSRVRLKSSPEGEGWVLLHARRLPRCWERLSERERDVVAALHSTGLNPKAAARTLSMSENTLNAHRRSICQKCLLEGPGEFWVFVEHCR